MHTATVIRVVGRWSPFSDESVTFWNVVVETGMEQGTIRWSVLGGVGCERF